MLILYSICKVNICDTIILKVRKCGSFSVDLVSPEPVKSMDT